MERSREHTPLPCEAVKGNTTFSDRLSAESDRTPVTHRVAEEEKKDITIQLDESLALGIDASPSPLPSPLFLSPFQPGSPFTPASSGLSPVTLPILRSPKSPSKSRNSRGRFSNAAGRTLEEGFVKAGTITRSIKKGEGTILEETEDGWTISDEGAFDLHMHNQSNLLVRKILRLQSLSLLRSTFHAVDSPNSSTPTIIFRIYLVVDSYRKRPLTADQLGDFVDVLELVISGNEGWEGVTGEERKLLERNVVEISMIWDDIASPIVPEGLDGYSIGLRTELMPHQVGAREKMRTIEESPLQMLDPEYEECTAMDGQSFYVNVFNGRVVSRPVTVSVSGGGILADEAGSGKTAEVLARIMEDLGSLPDVRYSSIYFDGSPSPPPIVMTKIGRQFPFDRHIAEQLALGPIAHELLEGYEYTPAELEQHERICRRVEKSRKITTTFPSLRSLMLNYIRTSPAIAQRRPLSNLSQSPLSELNSLLPYYTIRNNPSYLSSRAGKSVGNATQRIYLGSTLIVVPDHLTEQWEAEIQTHCSHPTSMEEFDTMSNEVEDTKLVLQRIVVDKASLVLPELEMMARYDLVIMAASVFSRALTEQHESLFFVHWKRLIVDEGNIFAGGSTLAMESRRLRFQICWAITATPTTNLVSSRLANQSSSKILANAKDLANVGTILTKLLSHSTTFLPEHNSFHKKIGALFVRGRTAALKSLFEATIVKTRSKDLVLDLPELVSRTVFVQPLPQERMVYNSLVALWVANRVTSQKEDEDYFFHAKQKSRLNELLHNFSVSAFFFGSTTFRGSLQDALVTVGDIVRDKSGEWSEQDREDIALALEHIRFAVQGEAFGGYLDSVTIGVEVRGMSAVLRRRFGAYSLDSSTSLLSATATNELSPTTAPPIFLPVDQLVTIRKLVLDIQKHGKWTDEETLTEEIITLHSKSLLPAQSGTRDRRRDKKAIPKPLPFDSSFLGTTLHRTTSAKMNYIMRAIRESPEEKFLIFSTISHCGLTTARLSEILDIFEIPHLLFHPTKKLTRGAIASLFNDPTSPYRALVVDPSSSVTRGIGLTGANRIIFLDALWKQDIEYQAIARAHRLGQKKDVIVEFVLFEEGWDHSVFKRRRELTEEELRSGKEVQKDEKLQGLLQSTQFLSEGEIGSREDWGHRREEEGATTFLFKDERNRFTIEPVAAARTEEEVATTMQVDTHGKRELERGVSEGPDRKKPKKSVRFVD